MMRELYAPVKAAMIVTDIKSAELIKHASNSFLATKISFANALAQMCDRVGADVTSSDQGMGADPRIGPSFLKAGLGYGGSCFPKDVSAFIHMAEEAGVDFKILRAVREVNDQARLWALDGLKRPSGICGRKPWRCGGWPLSPTRTICATRPRWTSSTGFRRKGAA
jgi:UDPglucose 6-dehydrogenase